MICPKCGCHDRVTRTETKPDRVLRHRRCIMCGTDWETEETMLNPTEAAPQPPAPKQPRRKKKGVSPLPTGEDVVLEDPKSETPRGALAAALQTAE